MFGYQYPEYNGRFIGRWSWSIFVVDCRQLTFEISEIQSGLVQGVAPNDYVGFAIVIFFMDTLD